MPSTFWSTHKLHGHTLTLDRRGLVYLAGLAGALYACLIPLPL